MTNSKPLRLLHISDLHFGRIEDRVLKKLESYITNAENHFDLAILTGDLTQRARSAQFIAAKEFLAKLKCPLFLVPGNHDVPLYNIFLRFFKPYSKFMRFFGEYAPKFYEDEHFVVCGLWTVNTLKVEEGTVTTSEIKDVEKRFLGSPSNKIRIIAFHHPLASSDSSKIGKALNRLRALKPHIMMWGHDHTSDAKHWDVASGTGPVMVAAGTSVSNRTREESNSFNILEFTDSQINVDVVTFDRQSADFKTTLRRQFEIKQIEAKV